MDVNHFKEVSDSLAGQLTADEQTLSSMAILSERLERLKQLSDKFDGVEFSPAVKKLAKSRGRVAVC